MNKIVLLGCTLLAAATVSGQPASAYDVFSYRYDYTKQSDSEKGETQLSKPTFVEPTPATVRVNNIYAAQEETPKSLKPIKMTSSSKSVNFSNRRK